MPNVFPGQKIEAKHLNQILDTQDREIKRGHDGSVKARLPFKAGGNMVICSGYNNGPLTLYAHQACVIRGDASVEYRETILAIGVALASDTSPRVGICLDEIPPGGIGRVCVAGVCWAQTDGTSGLFASLKAEMKIISLAASGGFAEVLAQRPAEQMALLRFPIGGTGTAPATGGLVLHSHQGIGDGGYLNQLGGGQ